MKGRILFTLWLACTLSTAAVSMEPGGRITVQGRLNTRCLPHRGGTVYLHVDVDATGFALPDRSYEPMNVAVVLDRSGSMADDRKLTYAKQALYELVDRLSGTDILSIVIYDDQIETLLPAGRVTDKRRIKGLIGEVMPRGSTNLGGGLQEGFAQVNGRFRSGFINRVILLSDGLANVGITDPGALDGIAERNRENAITLTTIGVGLDYNENLMLGLARHGGGNYYFVESPSQLGAIFERELHDLRYVVAAHARLELSLGPRVELADVIGCAYDRGDGRVTIPLGNLLANDHRELCVELRVPEGAGTLRVVRGILRTDTGVRCDGEFTAEIHYSDDAAELLRGTDWDIQPKVDIALSTRQVDRAMKALDEGRPGEAHGVVLGAVRSLQESDAPAHNTAAAAAIQAQLGRLNEYARQLKDTSIDARKLKKAVQYDNYEVQRKKP